MRCWKLPLKVDWICPRAGAAVGVLRPGHAVLPLVSLQGRPACSALGRVLAQLCEQGTLRDSCVITSATLSLRPSS